MPLSRILERVIQFVALLSHFEFLPENGRLTINMVMSTGSYILFSSLQLPTDHANPSINEYRR